MPTPINLSTPVNIGPMLIFNREVVSRTSSSSPATRKALLSPPPFTSARSGSSTPSARTSTASPVSLSSCTTSALRPVTPPLSSKLSSHHNQTSNTNKTSTDITQDGKYIYLTLTTANHIAALDISDLNNVKRLDDPDEDQPTIGPHYIKVTPDQKHVAVTDYFVQTGEIGLINTPADFHALYIDILDDGSLSFNRSIDFSREFANRGGAKPHSVVVFDFTDSENPLYY